jgi:hypothetical protein
VHFGLTMAPTSRICPLTVEDEMARPSDGGPPARGMRLLRAGRLAADHSRVAHDVPGLPERDLDAALATVGGFIDPVLGRTAAGRWDPDRLAWSD